MCKLQTTTSAESRKANKSNTKGSKARSYGVLKAKNPSPPQNGTLIPIFPPLSSMHHQPINLPTLGDTNQFASSVLGWCCDTNLGNFTLALLKISKATFT